MTEVSDSTGGTIVGETDVSVTTTEVRAGVGDGRLQARTARMKTRIGKVNLRDIKYSVIYFSDIGN
jgi:hypothetical protein